MQAQIIYSAVGERIRARRKTLGLTQVQLAPRLGMSRASLANIETGRQAVLIHQLYLVAEALGVLPTDLLPLSASDHRHDNATDLPLPDDLKPLQRRQIANLLE